MKTIKPFCFFILLSANISNIGAKTNSPSAFIFSQYPNKTVVIKDHTFTNANAYFSASTTYFFEIYKGGNANALITAFQKNNAVQSLVAGKITGDFQAFTLTLKSAQNKVWFKQLFATAGLNSIVINQNSIMDVSTL